MRSVQEPLLGRPAKLCPKPARRKRKRAAEPLRLPMVALIDRDGTVCGIFPKPDDLRAFLQGGAA